MKVMEEAGKVLSNSNYYWLASRAVNGDSTNVQFGLRRATTYLGFNYMFYSSGNTLSNAYSLRPVVSLGSSSQLSLKTEGTDGAPNTFEINF